MYLLEVAETIDECIDSDEHVSGGQVTLDVNIFDLKIYIYLHLLSCYNMGITCNAVALCPNIVISVAIV